MSNSKSNREQDQLISLTPTQQNPGSAKATDFQVRPYSPMATPFHNQSGKTARERQQLLNERLAGNPSQPIPTRNVAGGE